jgi:hypothetical protein
MKKWRAFVLMPTVLGGASLIALACRDVVAPVPFAGEVAYGVQPPKKDDEPRPARFRLTGGGRTDERNHTGFDKNTPESHDFATFGFQARPVAANTTEGSGNFTWVEHNPAAIGGGFSFHGRVTFFTTTTDASTAGNDDCGRFGGNGTARTRDGGTFEVSFVVEHACDHDEPGVGVDHISVRIIFPTGIYERHGLLSGGNIQKHKL